MKKPAAHSYSQSRVHTNDPSDVPQDTHTESSHGVQFKACVPGPHSSTEHSAHSVSFCLKKPDTHLKLLALSSKGLTGKIAEKVLDDIGITVNKNTVPFDTQSPFVGSGIRIGTPAITTRGMKESEMKEIAYLIDKVLTDPNNEKNIKEIRQEVNALVRKFPLYKGLIRRLEK